MTHFPIFHLFPKDNHPRQGGNRGSRVKIDGRGGVRGGRGGNRGRRRGGFGVEEPSEDNWCI